MKSLLIHTALFKQSKIFCHFVNVFCYWTQSQSYKNTAYLSSPDIGVREPDCLWLPSASFILQYPPNCSPLVTTILLSMSMSFCFSYLFICCFQFHIPHIREIILFLTFSISLFLLSMIFSRFTHDVKWLYFIFSWGCILFHSVCMFVHTHTSHILHLII